MLIRSLQAGVAAGTLLLASLAGAQPAPAWPTHAVKIVVPFQAGSATDLISRQFGQALSAEYGQPFIIENRPGAAAMIGSDAAARARRRWLHAADDRARHRW